MAPRMISIVGILVANFSFWLATRLQPGGYDWNRDYVSTLLRGPASQARLFAIVGMLFFCASVAFIFARLARASEFARGSKIIEIAGIGSMVYGFLAFTPMHDLMVTISLLFFLVAALVLLRALYVGRSLGFFVSGCVCLGVLAASAALYYTGHYGTALVWGQRGSFTFFAIWLVSLDCSILRSRVRAGEET